MNDEHETRRIALCLTKAQWAVVDHIADDLKLSSGPAASILFGALASWPRDTGEVRRALDAYLERLNREQNPPRPRLRLVK